MHDDLMACFLKRFQTKDFASIRKNLQQKPPESGDFQRVAEKQFFFDLFLLIIVKNSQKVQNKKEIGLNCYKLIKKSLVFKI